MQNETLLMMPGPVPVPERVRLAMATQAINHRGSDFSAVYDEITERLGPMFGTKNDIYLLSGSGTAGMEAAIGNFCADKTVACLVNGKFGDRLCKLSALYGNAVECVSEWGTPLPLDQLEAALENGAEAVTLVHNETSVAIKNPAEAVGKICKKHDALFILDGITSIAGDVVEADKWGADIAVVGSQKCLAAPAGLAAISISERAWDHLAEWRPFYLDMAAYKKSAAKSQTPYTPAIPLFFALREACRIIDEEGLMNRIMRHKTCSAAMRAAARAWGVELFATPDDLHQYSNTVTAFSYPEGIDDGEFRGRIKKMGIEFSGGQDHLKGKIFRIGSMGATGTPEVLAVLAAVQDTLRFYGFEPEHDGVQAAAEVL